MVKITIEELYAVEYAIRQLINAGYKMSQDRHPIGGNRKLCNLKHGIPSKPKVLGILPNFIWERRFRMVKCKICKKDKDIVCICGFCNECIKKYGHEYLSENKILDRFINMW